MQKAVFVGIDGAQLERLLLLDLQGKAQDINNLDIVESYVGGMAGTSSQQPTVSGPGWSTLLSGVWVDQHGIPSNNNQPINADVDSLFERIDAAIPDAKIASIVNWSPINTGHFALEAGFLGDPAIIDFEMHGISDADVTATVVDLIQTKAPDFTFLHLDSPDGVGHDQGFGPAYDQSLITASDQVGQILDAVAAREAANPDEDWLVIVSTDHGREAIGGFNHGAQTESERRTFVASNKELATFDAPVPATSVVSTILDHLGIPFDLSQIESGSLLEGAPDPLPPTIAAILEPEDGAMFVDLDTNLSLQFSEAIQAGAGFIHVRNYASDQVVQSVDVASAAVTISGDTLTVDLPENLGPGTRYYVTIDAGAVTDLPSGGGTVLFQEDFENLADDLGPFVSLSESGGDGTDWTATLPSGWTQQNATPAGGPAEFFGWTFLDVGSWAATASDQGRSQFANASGVVAVADPDEYDDLGDIDPDQFNARLTTPAIDITGSAAGSLQLGFDSSWLPEDLQEARVTVSYDGGAETQILRFSSDSADPDFKPDALNERITFDLANPGGASTLTLTFDMPQAGNDWWWAIDNIVVSDPDDGSVNAFRGIDDKVTWDFFTDEAASLVNIFFEDWESLADDLGPFVSATESGGDGTDWTNTLTNGWTTVNTTPAGGPAEFFGWTFLDVASWTATAGDQRRSEYTHATNVIAVADPDEYDDGLDIDPNLFDAALVSPEIDIAGVAAGRLRLTFDSSWRPEDTQKVTLSVSYDGGPAEEVLRWSSTVGDPDFHPDATNEVVILDLDNPAGAATVQFTFDMPVAGNDWWWAIDNISLDEVVPAVETISLLAEDFESLTDDLGPLVSASEGGGDGTDWTATAPAGWTLVNSAPPGGPAEFFGWTFFDLNSWVDTAGDQQRSGFTNASGVVAVADPDEYDDIGNIDPDLFDATLVSPVIDLTPAAEGTLTVSFDSSWRHEAPQQAGLLVSFDGGAQQEVFRWSSEAADPDFKADAVNERVTVSVDRPAGAGTMQLFFDMPQAGNNWWWAIDNIEVEGTPAGGGGSPNPDAVDDQLTTDADQVLTSSVGALLANDSDLDGDPLELILVNGDAPVPGDIIQLPSGATLSFNADGTGDYDPNGAFDGLAVGETATDSFTYTITDGTGTDTATVTITINGVNVAPVASNETYSTDENVTLTIPAASGVLVNDSDANGDPLGAILTRVPANGVLDFNNDGGFTYTPNAGFAGDDSFDYEVGDGRGGTATATATITVVEGSTDAPVIEIGGPGSQELVGAGGDDYLDGGGGDDQLTGKAGTDTLIGGIGHDQIEGGSGNDVVDGGAGRDQIVGDAGDDTIGGGSGDDEIDGGIGHDTIDGGNGHDQIDGGDGADQIIGGNGNDQIAGGAGTDTIGGGSGSDEIDGGDGNDVIDGGSGNDAVDGGGGDDQIIGGNGNDVLRGGDGDDVLWGQNGNDVIIGGLGNDMLSGNLGTDTFVLAIGAGTDTILDFDVTRDLVRLGSGLTIDDLSFEGVDNDTLITAAGQVLAHLDDVGTLGADDIMVV
jgi:Ca2+-binding RTX toxin-like protein